MKLSKCQLEVAKKGAVDNCWRYPVHLIMDMRLKTMAPLLVFLSHVTTSLKRELIGETTGLLADLTEYYK